MNKTTQALASGLIPLVPSLLAVLLLASCTLPGRYTSLDLALLPCESRSADTVFFSPVEFKADGTLFDPRQKEVLIDYLERGTFTDLFLFLHGWNKNPSSAEFDYQNFICRFHAKLDETLHASKRRGNLKVVGIFWPSTISNRAQEPMLIKPASYYRIRNRVDDLARSALAPLLDSIGEVLIALGDRGGQRRLHLVGHSFGGRMIIRSFQTLNDTGQLVPILESVDATNVVLINAAAPPTFFGWINEAVIDAWLKERPARFTDSTDSFLVNLHSDRDLANKYLFRMASAFNTDPQSCAVGACGIPDVPTLCVNEIGKVVEPEAQASARRPELNVRNIDASAIVYGHSDIYKGRIASLVADLLYDPETRLLLERPAPVDPTCH
jgi:pimeloyl-ACP methyl ester carboxylesterase